MNLLPTRLLEWRQTKVTGPLSQVKWSFIQIVIPLLTLEKIMRFGKPQMVEHPLIYCSHLEQTQLIRLSTLRFHRVIQMLFI